MNFKGNDDGSGIIDKSIVSDKDEYIDKVDMTCHLSDSETMTNFDFMWIVAIPTVYFETSAA